MSPSPLPPSRVRWRLPPSARPSWRLPRGVDPGSVDEAVASAVEELTRVGLLWDDGVRRHPLREFRDTAIRLLTDPRG